MTKTGQREYLRRALVLLFLTLGLIGFGHWNPIAAGLLIATAIGIYACLPRVAPPPNALIYEPMPAVVGPDVIGFLLTSLFIALPFWARLDNTRMWDDFGPMVHPAALLTWPVAFVSIFILIMAARHASFWIVIEPQGLRLSSHQRQGLIIFDQIKEVAPYRRGLPKWLKWITPLLVLTGRFSAAGAILVSRDTTGMTLRLEDGSTINISESAYEKPFRQILETLLRHDVALDRSFIRRLNRNRK